jgi:hypothetical protein
MSIEFTSEQLTNLAEHIRNRYYEIKKERKEQKEEPPHELLTCAQQIETIKDTPYMLQDILILVEWDIAGEDLEELPLKFGRDTDLLTKEIIMWRLENGI